MIISNEDALEPVGGAIISTAAIGNINHQLFCTNRLEVLQTCEEASLEIIE